MQALRLDLGNLGQDGATLRGDYLGAYAPSVRRCFQSADGEDNGVELFNLTYKRRIPTNWKFPGFSFDGGSAHGAMTHRSINVAAIGPQGEAGGGDRHRLRAAFPSTAYEMSIPEVASLAAGSNDEVSRGAESQRRA